MSKPSSPHDNLDLPWGTAHASVAVACAILLIVLIVAMVTATPVRPLAPYALAVGIVTWKHGLGWGTAFGVPATLIWFGSTISRDGSLNLTDEITTAIEVFALLCNAAIGVAIGKRFGARIIK